MLNYQKIYKKYYRKMPKIIFITLVAVLGLIAIIDLLASSKFFIYPYSGLLSFIVGSEAFSSFIFALLLWTIFTGVIAGLVSFHVACFISARIVMIDAIIQVSTKLDSIVDKKENNEVNVVKQQAIEIQPLQETGAPHIETRHEANNQASVETQSNNRAKTIVKTKIVETHQRESNASKKRGKWLSALATGLIAGSGGSTQDILEAQHTQNGHNKKNASFETVVTFLVIYSDNSRATVETIQGDERYNKYIMYVD